MNKILAVVKFNDGEAYVLRDEVKLEYQKYNGIIIGTDGYFLKCYYERPPIPPSNKNWSGWQAFGGRRFDIHLIDGSIEHCYGQWWDGIGNNCMNIIGDEIVNIVAENIDNLKNCYVFRGYQGIKKNIEKLRKAYTGEIYDYWEYCKNLKALEEK